MQRLWFPAWLYRLLPLAYLAGAAVMFHLFGDQLVGLLSAVFLSVAAVLIWGLRLYTRR